MDGGIWVPSFCECSSIRLRYIDVNTASDSVFSVIVKSTRRELRGIPDVSLLDQGLNSIPCALILHGRLLPLRHDRELYSGGTIIKSV